MSHHLYTAWNFAMVTTTAPAAVATGTTLKTMLQVATPSTRKFKIYEWGYENDAAAGADATFELIQTDIAATVTAHIASGVQPIDPGMPASLATLGVAATGFTGTAEGAITATRSLDTVRMDTAFPHSRISYKWIFPPDARPLIAVSSFVRIRALTPTTGVNQLCYIRWGE